MIVFQVQFFGSTRSICRDEQNYHGRYSLDSWCLSCTWRFQSHAILLMKHIVAWFFVLWIVNEIFKSYFDTGHGLACFECVRFNLYGGAQNHCFLTSIAKGITLQLCNYPFFPQKAQAHGPRPCIFKIRIMTKICKPLIIQPIHVWCHFLDNEFHGFYFFSKSLIFNNLSQNWSWDEIWILLCSIRICSRFPIDSCKMRLLDWWTGLCFAFKVFFFNSQLSSSILNLAVPDLSYNSEDVICRDQELFNVCHEVDAGEYGINPTRRPVRLASFMPYFITASYEASHGNILVLCGVTFNWLAC